VLRWGKRRSDPTLLGSGRLILRVFASIRFRGALAPALFVSPCSVKPIANLLSCWLALVALVGKPVPRSETSSRERKASRLQDALVLQQRPLPLPIHRKTVITGTIAKTRSKALQTRFVLKAVSYVGIGLSAPLSYAAPHCIWVKLVPCCRSERNS
jgi:hypothetical protein